MYKVYVIETPDELLELLPGHAYSGEEALKEQPPTIKDLKLVITNGKILISTSDERFNLTKIKGAEVLAKILMEKKISLSVDWKVFRNE